MEVCMKNHGILTINQMAFKDLACFMFKQNNGLNPLAFDDIFQRNQIKHNTRSKTSIIPGHCNSSTAQQAISHCGPILWANIPPVIRNKKQSVKSFNKRIKTYLLAKGN